LLNSSCDRLFIALPCLFVIYICRDLPYTHFEVSNDDQPSDFSFDLLSSVCATDVEINGRVSKYGTSGLKCIETSDINYLNILTCLTYVVLDLVAFIYTECMDVNSYETRCVSFRVENGSKHWYRSSSTSIDEIDVEVLYACFSKSFLLAYKQRCY
jgi:hypothetical protein